MIHELTWGVMEALRALHIHIVIYLYYDRVEPCEDGALGSSWAPPYERVAVINIVAREGKQFTFAAWVNSCFSESGLLAVCMW